MRADLHPHGVVAPGGQREAVIFPSGKIHILQSNRYRVAVSAGTHRALGHSADGLQVRPGGAQRPFLCPFGSEHAALRLKDRIPHRQLQFLVRL